MKLPFARAAVTTIACLPLAFGAVQEAQASTIVYDNGTPDNLNSVLSGRVNSSTVVRQADNFTLSQPTLITDIHWWGTYGNAATNPTTPGPDAFFANIYSDSGSGSPGALLNSLNLGAVGAKLTGNSTPAPNNFPIYEYWVDIAPLNLPASPYWLSIYNDATKGWAWATSAQTGNSYTQVNTGAWNPATNQRELAFNLTTTPEPASTIGFIALGTLGAASALKRKLNKSDRVNGDKS